MSTLTQAISIAMTAHAGQTDQQGVPYISHPLRVMQAVQGRGEAFAIVGVLHDVLEDTKVTADDLRANGFSDEVMAALDSVTRRRNESYADFILRCSVDNIGGVIKIADLEDNASMRRLLLRSGRLASDIDRMVRYGLAYKFLIGEMDSAVYRDRAAWWAMTKRMG